MDAERMNQDLRSQPTTGFFGLRFKFVLLFSMILIVTCSSLSWYFIETRRSVMMDNLQELGTILLTNTVRNDHFRIGGIVLEDRETLEQFMNSLMAIDRVVYVMITTSDGRVLDQQSKRTNRLRAGSPDTSPQPLYPDDSLLESLGKTPLTAPLITQLVLASNQTLIPQDESSDWLLPFLVRQETLYDFAMPVLKDSARSSHLSEELDEKRGTSFPTAHPPVVGVVRIGMTDAQAKATLLIIIRNVALLTLFIIAAGILSAHLLTSRITIPLRNLAGAAKQLADGQDAPVPFAVSTKDEVGQLTHAFNVMTQSLHERNQAITLNLETIKRQVTQLTTAHKVSTAIASANMLNLDQLLKAVLPLLSDNLAFSKMAVLLYHPEKKACSIAQVMGAGPEIDEAARLLEIPINEGSITADLLFHRKPFLIQDIEADAHRFYPPIFHLLQRSGTRSIVVVPLLSQAKILGFLAGGRDTHPCSEDDLDILLTIAGHVAAAIDNAKAYSELAELTQHLEERIEQRTEELSYANAQLQEHDRRRSTFLSVVSHELRTPMTAIRSFAENMLDGVTGPLTELQHTYLTRIQHNVARLGRIIAQLLDWSRLDTQRVELHLEEVCVHQIAMIVTDSLRMVASEKTVSLEIPTVQSLPSVQGDRDKLEQIFWNLIGNAIKFTPPGGQVAVEFGLSPPGFVQTCISDSGCGIDPAHVPHIFDEFSRVPSAMPASQGAQLGLCITKTLVAMHHGQIWVESQPQAGSRFYFTLPVSTSPDELPPKAAEEAEQHLS
ncbi:MAG: GAF domain-containing protein [Nitrospira sp.]|nr:GAF domain-containing protein [Nitrospira sp.]